MRVFTDRRKNTKVFRVLGTVQRPKALSFFQHMRKPRFFCSALIRGELAVY